MADEIKLHVFQKGASKGIPVSGTFELTPRCNLDCKMCYIHMSEKEQNSAGKELTAGEWIELGRQAVKEGMIYLLLTGGEPLLRSDFLEIYEELIQMGLMITVNTNGILINEEVIECFKRYRPEKVNVTLYGMSADTYGSLCGFAGGYEKALRGIRELKKVGIRVSLNSTFTKINLPDMEKIIAFAKGEEIPIRMASYVFPPIRNCHEITPVNLTAEEMGIAAARFDELTLEKDRIAARQKYIAECLAQDVQNTSTDSACMAGRGAFWISWDGNMYPCGMLSSYVSNVREKNFLESWNETKEKTKMIRLPKECSNCNYQKLCPSCAAVSASVNERTDELADALCIRTKSYVEYFMKVKK